MTNLIVILDDWNLYYAQNKLKIASFRPYIAKIILINLFDYHLRLITTRFEGVLIRYVFFRNCSYFIDIIKMIMSIKFVLRILQSSFLLLVIGGTIFSFFIISIK